MRFVMRVTNNWLEMVLERVFLSFSFLTNPIIPHIMIIFDLLILLISSSLIQ